MLDDLVSFETTSKAEYVNPIPGESPENSASSANDVSEMQFADEDLGLASIEECRSSEGTSCTDAPLVLSFAEDCDTTTTTTDAETQCELLVRATRNVEVQTEPVLFACQTDNNPPSPHEVAHSVAVDHCYSHKTLPSSPVPSTSQAQYISPSKSISSGPVDSDSDNTEDIYLPGSADSQSETEADNEPDRGLLQQKKFIVFEEQLDKLFVSCSICGKPIAESSKTFVGSMVVVQSSCIDGHDKTWQSQPMIHGKVAGNMMIAASILFSGNSFANVNSLACRLNLAFISSALFYKIQKNLLFPVIEKTWKEHQDNLFKEIRKSKKLEVCGDGRSDSPGHCAKYGTYTIMDESSSKIIDFSVVQVTEVSSSNAMEAEGCNRVLQNMKAKKVKVKCLTTDRHVTITSEMKKKHPKITHQYDVWHLAKWVVKKLTKKAKKKDCAELMTWIQSVSAHFWWSISTCEGNYDLLLEKWTSIVHHVGNKHSWRKSKLFKKCVHHKLTRREVKATCWLKPGTAAHVALEEIVFNSRLLKDMKLVTEFHHTGNLEVYHSMMLKYCPKRQHFSNEGMVARTQLAALDNNNNCTREQAVIQHGESKGSLRYNVVFPKVRKTWVVKPIKQPKTYSYLDDMMERVLKGDEVDGACKSAPFAKNIATKPKPNKSAAIASHISRFKQK